MQILSGKERDKTSSEKLREKIYACLSSFQKIEIVKEKVAFPLGFFAGFYEHCVNRLNRQGYAKSG